MQNFDDYDPPTYGGTPMQEAHLEMTLIYGMENPDSQWVLTGYDVWEKNPYYHGPDQQHPEDDTPTDLWEAAELERLTKVKEFVPSRWVDEDEIPF